jgi:Pyruvate/2-oxoacid:ferredoxin oxidoreductase delta subunit
MKKSTVNIFRMHGWRVDRAVHNYIYFVFYDKYVKTFLASGRYLMKLLGPGRINRLAFKNVYENYHAKVLTHGDARKILRLNRDLSLDAGKAKKIIPFSAANKIIFSQPDFIAVMDCPCRLSRKEHCEPVNVCMAVGRTTAEFWLDHCARYHVRRITQAQALELLEQSARLNRIITAWLKTETGGRTGVICSCCSCCCGGIEGMKLARRLPGDVKVTNMISSGYSVTVDAGVCTSCGSCVEICAYDACHKTDGGSTVYDREACLGCGVCTTNCPSGARKLVLDSGKGAPLDVGLPAAETGT